MEDVLGKRNAIRLHETYTVETVVVADSDMVQYHGAEAAQRFLLTVMNMVRPELFVLCSANRVSSVFLFQILLVPFVFLQTMFSCDGGRVEKREDCSKNTVDNLILILDWIEVHVI